MEGAWVRTAFILLKSLESLDTVQVGLITPENMCSSIWNSEEEQLMINDVRCENSSTNYTKNGPKTVLIGILTREILESRHDAALAAYYFVGMTTP